MPNDERSLKIGSSVDVGSVREGMDQAAAAVEKSTDRMQASFEDTSAAAESTYNRVIDKTKEVAERHAEVLEAVERVPTAISNIVDSVTNVVKKTLEWGTAIGATTVAVSNSVAAHTAVESILGHTVTAYRSVRLAAAGWQSYITASAVPLAITATLMGTVMLGEQTVKLAYHQALYNRELAITAARTERTFQDTATYYQFLNKVTSAKIPIPDQNPIQLSKLIGEYQKLKDPVDKAKFAVDNFGEDAEKWMPLLTAHTRESVAAAYDLAAALDGKTRVALEHLTDDLPHPIRRLQEMIDGFRQAGEAIKMWGIQAVAAAHDWVHSSSLLVLPKLPMAAAEMGMDIALPQRKVGGVPLTPDLKHKMPGGAGTPTAALDKSIAAHDAEEAALKAKAEEALKAYEGKSAALQRQLSDAATGLAKAQKEDNYQHILDNIKKIQELTPQLEAARKRELYEKEKPGLDLRDKQMVETQELGYLEKRLQAEESAARTKYELHHLSEAKLTEILLEGQKKRYEAQMRHADAVNALKVKENALEGRPAGIPVVNKDEIAADNAQRIQEIQQHQQKSNQALVQAQEHARAESINRIAQAEITASNAAAAERLRTGELTEARYRDIALDNQKRAYDSEVQYTTRQIELAKKRGESGTAEVITLNAKLQELQTQDTQKRAEINNRATDTDRAAAEQAAKIAAANEKNLTDTRAEIRRQEAGRLLEDRKIVAAQERDILLGEEEKKNKAARVVLDQELQAAKAHGEKGKDEVARVNAQIEELELKHQATIASIRADADRKALAERQRWIDEEVGLVTRKATRELEASQHAAEQANKLGLSSRIASLQAEADAVNVWSAKQQVAFQRNLDFAKQRYGENSLEAQKVMDKIADLEAERAKRIRDLQEKSVEGVRQWGYRATDILFSSFNEFLQGQRTLGQAISGIWKGIVMSIVQEIEKMAAKWIVTHIIMAAAAKLFHIKQIQDNTAAIAAKVAANNAANVEMGTSDAWLAAVAAFESVMAALPFPENVATAPGVAAETLTTALDMASMSAYEHGGVVPKTDLALLHKDEMVLEKPLSDFVRQSAAQAGGSSGGSAFHYHAAPGESPQSIDRNLSALGRAYRDGRIPKLRQ